MEINEVTIKSLFDQEVSLIERGDRVRVDARHNISLSEQDVRHLLGHGLIVTRIDSRREQIYIGKLNQTVRNGISPLELE